jgi:branched-chain amino acid transport system substrate-binding protein
MRRPGVFQKNLDPIGGGAMANQKCLLTVIVVLSLFFCSLSMSTSALAQQKAEPIKIGVLLPLTGALLKQGPLGKEGVEMALEDANYEVAGRKIVLIVEDDATDPTTGLDKARKLVERDKVAAIIGPQHAGVANAIQPYINTKKIVNLKIMQFPKALKAKYPWMLALNGTQEQTSVPMGWYAYEKLGYKTVTTIGPDFVAGRAFLGGFMAGFKEKGGTVVQEQWFSVGSIDFGPYLGNLNDADAFCGWVEGPGALRLVNQYYEYGTNKKMPLIGAYASNLLDEDVLPQLGEKGLGIYAPTAYASTLDNPINKRVVDKFKAKHGGVRPTDTLMVGGYMNAFVLLHALKGTGGDTDPEKLRAAILNLNLKDSPIGPVRFTPEGLGILNMYIIKTAKVGNEYLWEVVQTYHNTEPR